MLLLWCKILPLFSFIVIDFKNYYSVSTKSIPHLVHTPGLSAFMSGCMVQVYTILLLLAGVVVDVCFVADGPQDVSAVAKHIMISSFMLFVF